MRKVEIHAVRAEAMADAAVFRSVRLHGKRGERTERRSGIEPGVRLRIPFPVCLFGSHLKFYLSLFTAFRAARIALRISGGFSLRTCAGGEKSESGAHRECSERDRKSTRLNSSHQIISYAA